MPYRNYRKNNYKRKYYNNKYKQMSLKAINLANKALSLTHKEHKYIDVTSSSTSSTTPAVVLLNGCAQGDTGTTREGQKIKMTSLLIRCYATINSANATTTERIIIFIDYQANAAAPSASSILQTTTSVLSPLVIGNGKRFKILADQRLYLSITGDQVNEWTRYIKLNEVVTFNTTSGGTIADIQTGSLYMLHMSDQVGNLPTLNYYSRVRFIDG